MSQKRTHEKNLLFQFTYFTNEEIEEVLKEELTNHLKDIEATNKCKEILSKYGVDVYINIDIDLKKRVEKLLEVAKLRNITILECWYHFELNEFDIISKINEIKYEKLNLLRDYGYDTDEEIEQIRELYDNIIKEEYGEIIYNQSKEKLPFIGHHYPEIFLKKLKRRHK